MDFDPHWIWSQTLWICSRKIGFRQQLRAFWSTKVRFLTHRQGREWNICGCSSKFNIQEKPKKKNWILSGFNHPNSGGCPSLRCGHTRFWPKLARKITFFEWSPQPEILSVIFILTCYLALDLTYLPTFYQHIFWHSIWHAVWHSIWHLALSVEVRQCPLRSGARSWGPAVPIDIWRSRIRAESEREVDDEEEEEDKEAEEGWQHAAPARWAKIQQFIIGFTHVFSIRRAVDWRSRSTISREADGNLWYSSHPSKHHLHIPRTTKRPCSVLCHHIPSSDRCDRQGIWLAARRTNTPPDPCHGFGMGWRWKKVDAKIQGEFKVWFQTHFVDVSDWRAVCKNPKARVFVWN